jgi:hypothetical protein
MLDWMNESCKNILALIPAIKGGRIDIDPPPDHFFTLKTSAGYFVRFHSILPGSRTSQNVRNAARFENLLIAGAMALFWKGDDPASKETIFVEAVRRDAVEYMPRRRRWYSEDSSEPVSVKRRTDDELVKIKTEEEIRIAVSQV